MLLLLDWSTFFSSLLKNKSTDEKVKQRLRAEEKLAGLQAEKDKVETVCDNSGLGSHRCFL